MTSPSRPENENTSQDDPFASTAKPGSNEDVVDASASHASIADDAKGKGELANDTTVQGSTDSYAEEERETTELKMGSSTESDDSDIEPSQIPGDCSFDDLEDLKVWKDKEFARGQRRGKPDDVKDIKSLLGPSIVVWNAHRCDNEQRWKNYIREMSNLVILVPKVMLDGIEICMDRLNRHLKQCEPTAK